MAALEECSQNRFDLHLVCKENIGHLVDHNLGRFGVHKKLVQFAVLPKMVLVPLSKRVRLNTTDSSTLFT